MLFKRPQQNPREVIIVRASPATDFSFVDKWSNILLTVTFTICLIGFCWLVACIFFVPQQAPDESIQAEVERIQAELDQWKAINARLQNDLPSSPVQSTEDLRSGDPNSQVIGDHLGGLDRPDVRVGEERGAGELQPQLLVGLDGEGPKIPPAEPQIVRPNPGQGR